MTRRTVFSSLNTGTNMLTFAALLMYIMLSVIVTYPLTFHLENFVTNAIDPLLYAWNLHHNFLALISPERNFLDTNMFYPTTNTIAYSDHLLGQSLVLLPFFFVISNPLVIQNMYILATFVLAAFGMYLLCSYFTKNFLASFICGIVYSFSFYHIDHAGQVPTTSIQWIPLIFLYLFKSVETKRNSDILLFWLFFTLNFLSTLYYGLFILIPLGIFAVMNYKMWRFFLKCFLLGIPFFLVIILASYPYIIFTLENPTIKRSLDESGQRSAQLLDYLLPRFIHDRALFLGLPIIFFVIFDSIRPFRKQLTLFFLSAGITCLLFSLGPYYGTLELPYYYMYKIVPLFQAIRVPARFGIIVLACFSILAGFGIHSFMQLLKKRGIRYVFLAVVLFAIVAQLSKQPLRSTTVPTLADAPEVYRWLSQQPDGVVLELPLRHGYHSNRIDQQVVVPYEKITENDNYIAETYRLYFSTIHQKRMINGYSSYFPTTYQEIATAMETFPVPYAIEQIKKYNVKYIILHKNQYGATWSRIEKEASQVKDLEKVKDFDSEIVYLVN